MSILPERLLVVDDDAGLLLFMRRSLEKQGYEVSSSSDGFQALEILQSSPPFSVLVTDLLMPHMSGLELLRRARALDENLQIIVITAADSVDLAITAMKDGGVYDYLKKPLESISQLAMVVERAAVHRRLVMERALLQRQAEKEARRLQTLVSSIGEAILVAAADGVITAANPAALKMIGRGQVTGERALDVLPSRLVSIVNNWQTAGGHSPAVMEIPWIADTIQMVSLTPIQDQEDHWEGWALVMRDITPFKRLDELKTQAMNEAAGKIRRPLAEAMSALVELNRLALQDERFALQDERLGTSLYKLSEAWKRIQGYIDELVRMTHQEASLESMVSEVDLNKSLGDVERELNTELYWQGRGKLTLQLNSQLPPIQTDGDMLHQLLLGLVKRAALRSPLGGNIRVDAREINGRVYIDVIDDGPAVTDTGMLHMFDHSALEPSLAGSGGGVELARARAQLEEVGGQLWVGGRSRRGSTVTLCLPAVAQQVRKRTDRELQP